MKRTLITMLVFLVLFLGWKSLTVLQREPEYPKCYSLKYLHVSGTEQWMQMQMTDKEARRLHEDIYDEVPVLAVNTLGYTLHKRDIRVIGATGIISLTPCQ